MPNATGTLADLIPPQPAPAIPVSQAAPDPGAIVPPLPPGFILDTPSTPTNTSIPAPRAGFTVDPWSAVSQGDPAKSTAGRPIVPPLPPGFTLDTPGGDRTGPTVLAGTQMYGGAPPAPVSGGADAIPPLPPGFTLDGPSIDPITGQPTQSLTQAPVPLGERFLTNAKSAIDGTLLGSTANYLAGKLAPDSNPIDPNTGKPLGGPTPREQVQQSVIRDQQDAAQMPGWQTEGGTDLTAKVLAGGAALAGSLGGGMLSPESLVAGPESYGAVRAGEALVPAIAKSAGVQAAVQGAANAGAQGINMAAGTQDQFDPWEVVQAGGTGAAIGALHPAVAGAVNAIKGVRAPEGGPVPEAGAGTRADAQASVAPNAADQTGPAATKPAPVTTETALVAQDAGYVPGQQPPGAMPVPSPTETDAPGAASAVPPASSAQPNGPVPSDAAPSPGPDPNAGTVTTAAGRKVDVRYEVANAADLVPASGDLQPRERADRLASDAQVQNIAANLDPDRLMRASEADRGAPIVGPDNVIESGNGRVMAIQQAAANHPDAYARYVQALQAAGHDTTGVDTPVLVARRQTPMTPAERVAFVQEANQSATQRMSAPEQARVDGNALTPTMLAKYDPTQPATSAGNRAFVRDWINTLPEAERNGVQDAQGALSADGVRRLNGAMLARAYDDPGVLARGLESTDDATRSISGAMADAAPAWAQLRADTQAGAVPPEFDTSKQLVQAADIVRQAREKRQTMSDILNQQDAFNPIDPVTEQYVRALYDPTGTRPASRPAIADTLKRYADEARKQSTSAGLFGDADKVRPVDALKTIVGNRVKRPEPVQGTMLGNGTGLERGGDRLAADDRPMHELADEPDEQGSPVHEGAQSDLPFGDHSANAANATGNRDGTTRAPLGGVRPERDFNRETSPYRQVFRDAGHNPDTAVSLPIQRQVKIVADHVRDALGFKDVRVDARQDPKEIRDQLSNLYQNAQEMAHALAMPLKGLGLDGRLTLETKPYRQPNQALGSYAPGSRTINIPGRSNSFAHEYAHALDHYLADALANNPKATRLLSMTKGVGEDPAKIAGKPVLPNTPAEAFVNVLRTMYGKHAATAAEALRAQYDLRSGDVTKSLAAQRKLDAIGETDFAKNAKAVPGGKDYWGTPHEMLARAHEAYVSDMIQRGGGDTRAITKPYYDDQGKDGLAKFYPQASERDAIFQSFTDLYDRLRAQSILGAGTADRPTGLDIVDVPSWGKLADTKADLALTGRLQREVQALKNFGDQLRDNLGFRKDGAVPGGLTIGTRAMDSVRVATHSMRSRAEMYVHRQPTPEARAALQGIVDKITPAEGLRSPEAAAGREVGPVFEQAARRNAQRNVVAFENALDDHGLTKMTPTQELMLHHVLTTGDVTSFVPPNSTTGRPVPVPPAIATAAGKIRYLLDQEWERNKAAGIDVGYAKSGYFPRVDDDYKIWRDRTGFETQAGKVYKGMFDSEVGGDPVKLLEAHDRLAKTVRDGLPQETQNGIAKLRANLRAQDKLDPADPAIASALDTLRNEAADLHDQHSGAVGDAFAADAAREWWLHKATGNPTDFTHRGPNASYTAGRVLPPEADQLLRDYRLTDPRQVLTRYFQSGARKIAFAERFGANGEKLDAAFRRAADQGANPEDIAALRRIVEGSTGRLKTGVAPGWESALDKIHALGTMALMGRAAFSSLTEPTSILARDGTLKDVMLTFARQIGGALGTASSKDRAEISRLIGNTTSHFYDTMLADRMNATYRDSPQTGKWLSNYFRTIGLTQLTNGQRTAMIGTGHDMLNRFGQDYLGSNPRLVRDAAANFRDYGIADKDHKPFAEWITSHPGIPAPADLQTTGGQLWGHAITSLIDKAIQSPLRMDKPELALNPTTRLAYGLMSFQYSYFHNVMEHMIGTAQARIGEGYSDARAAGRGKIMSVASAVPAAGRAAAGASVFGAALVGGSYLSTALRAYLTDQGSWQRHEDAGDLHDWLMNSAIARTGAGGPLDAVAQAVTSLKYERDLSGLFAGAQAGYFLSAATDIAKWASGAGSPNTNTATHNGIRGAFNLLAVPAAAVGLSSLPGGPFARAAYGAALMRATSRGAAESVADSLVGPKGTKVGGEPPSPVPPSKTGQSGGVPIGLADDVAVPAVRAAMPLWERLPVVGKVGLGVAAGGYAASRLANEFARFRDGSGPGGH